MYLTVSFGRLATVAGAGRVRAPGVGAPVGANRESKVRRAVDPALHGAIDARQVGLPAASMSSKLPRISPTSPAVPLPPKVVVQVELPSKAV